MTGRNGLHYRYDVLYQYWFALEEEKIYCNNFNSSDYLWLQVLIGFEAAFGELQLFREY